MDPRGAMDAYKCRREGSKWSLRGSVSVCQWWQWQPISHNFDDEQDPNPNPHHIEN
jgi:hypothetical protein